MTSHIEQIAPEKVSVDQTVQRTLDGRRANGIVGALRRDAIGVPTISRRTGGALIVLDGQHRLEALRIAGYGSEPIDMKVFDGLAVEEEAELFRLLNNTKSLTALDKFRIALVERDPETVNINDIVVTNGYVTTAGASNSCVAVATLRAIYHRDQGDTLHRTLSVCQMAWGTRKHATHQTILGALAAMLFRYGNTVELERLADKLRSHRDASNPTVFLGNVVSLAQANGSSTASAGGGKLVTIYNAHFDASSQRRLADWR